MDNCVTVNTLFQSKITVNVFKVEIYVLKQVKITTAFVFIIQEMKAVTNSNGGLVVHLVSLKYVKTRPTGKAYNFNLHKWRNDMPSKARLENF